MTADAIRQALADLEDVVTAAIPESPLLSAPTFRALVEALTASWCWAARLDGSGGFGCDRGGDEPAARPGSAGADVAVIAASDRADLLPGLMLARQSGTFPRWRGSCSPVGTRCPRPSVGCPKVCSKTCRSR